MKRLKLFIAVILCSYSSVMFGQQDAQYTQYMYNTININPAYAGSRGAISILGLHRTQWVGLDGAPKTNTLSINAPISPNMGLGMSVINDNIGPSTENNISVDLAYTLDVSPFYKLSFGLKGTANLLNVDFTKLNIYDPADPRFQYNIDNKFSPNIGAGVYLHSNKSYLGLSIPNMLENSHYNKSAKDESQNYVVKERMHYYLIAGYVFDLDYNLKFKPSFLTKVVEGAPLQTDISANFLFNEKFTAGLAYRWSASVSGIAGFQVSDSLFVGYAYDAETTKLANYNSGSHEIFLRFEVLGRSKSRMMSPRFF
ncbi:type IX secretion system membrane protein PorP/SprF [Flavobacterium sp. LS1R47]|uniref:Type IX secretion system membrane protein PorP/SprF n=1 Tax=Flavobacterium frigoritolerans TaxID=2987686 RepID=A0A9X2ZN36_9FLAO|nr:type IX secretion system membrane protein PorP/SprF [Flavobacterium frigoritolerans]MCV9931566.1 type IX secretion system membrane protein PorP/SprF [Flavobacterium frigoritolerans]